MEPQLIYIINSGSLVVPRSTVHPFVYDERHQPILHKLYGLSSISSVSRDREGVAGLNSALAASAIFPVKAIQLNQQVMRRFTQGMDMLLRVPVINDRLHRTVFSGQLSKKQRPGITCVSNTASIQRSGLPSSLKAAMLKHVLRAKKRTELDNVMLLSWALPASDKRTPGKIIPQLPVGVTEQSEEKLIQGFRIQWHSRKETQVKQKYDK